jgi:hypothetical protein
MKSGEEKLIFVAFGISREMKHSVRNIKSSHNYVKMSPDVMRFYRIKM